MLLTTTLGRIDWLSRILFISIVHLVKNMHKFEHPYTFFELFSPVLETAEDLKTCRPKNDEKKNANPNE